MAEGIGYGKTMVLTGAGASAALGLPTMAQLTEMAYRGTKPLSEMAHKVALAKGDDVEAIYESLEFYIEIGKRAGEGDQNLRGAFGGQAENLGQLASRALSHLQGLILSTCGRVEAATSDPPEDAAYEYAELLNKLRDSNGQPLRVFTLNYDLAYEGMFGIDGIVNGMRAEGLDYVWDPSVYDDMDPASPFVIYRLHGCSHWFRDSGRGTVLYQSHPAVSRSGLLPMVIFPSRSKPLGRIDDIFAFAHRSLRGALATAEVCIVIGCSFRDETIVDALRSADPDTQFIVVDPGLDQARVRAAVGRHDALLIRALLGAEGTQQLVLEAASAALSYELGGWRPHIAGTEFDYIRG